MTQRTSVPVQLPHFFFIRSAALVVLVCLVANVPLVRAQQWVLDNGKVSRVIAFDAQSGLYTKSWRDLESQTELINEKDVRDSFCKEFEVVVDGRPITGSSQAMTLEGAPVAVEHGADKSLDVTLAARGTPLRVVVHYQVPAGFAAVRQWLTLENTGEKPVTLRNLTVACQAVSPGPIRDLIAYGHYGEEPRELFFTARVNDVAPLVENARTGLGLAVLSEVPGVLRRTETGASVDVAGGWNHNVRAMYDTDLYPFERRLAPGEKFETAASSVVFYRRGTATDPHWILPQYVEQVIAHNKNDLQPEWMYDGAYDEASNAKMAAMGLTMQTFDQGWEKWLGDNTIDTNHFPKDLDPVYVPSFKRGLWFPIGVVANDAPVLREHPEWVSRGRFGELRSSQGWGTEMCLASPYKKTVLERLENGVERYKIDYVKLDLTTTFNTYGEEPGCYEPNHEHATSAESTVRQYEALNWLADKLHERFPHLLIDYTFELWGGFNLIDYGLLRVADLDWMSNVSDGGPNDGGPMNARVLLYQRGMSIPTETMLIGNLQGEQPSWQERVATEMGSAPLLLGDLSKLSAQDAKQASEWIARFRKLRADVRLQESFFPLGSWRQPRVNEWDGYARFAKTGEGLIAIFRNDSVDSRAKIVIPGFPDGAFSVTDWQSGTRTTIQGKTLRGGWEVPIAGKPRVSILELRKQ